MNGSRRFRHRHLSSAVAAAVSMIAACGAAPDPAGDLEVVSAQALTLNTVVDSYNVNSVKANTQTPVAAVVDVGPFNYSVAHVNIYDELVYSHYSTNVGPQVGVFATQQGARWIRANASPAFSRSCGFGGHTTEYVNFFAVQTGGSVRLERVSICGQTWNAVNSLNIDQGDNPSFATRGNLNAGKGLLVYGQGNRLLGRFIGFSEFGTSVGSAFQIAQFSGAAPYIFSTDVIYNQQSGRFIVGYIQRSTMQFCHVKNVTVAEGAPPVVGTATPFGTCDSDAGGHATSVAYSPLAGGRYVWWRQDHMTSKGIYPHGSMGEILAGHQQRTDQPNEEQQFTAWTVPVAATSNSEFPYMFMQSNLVWAMKDGKPVKVGSDSGPDDVALALRSVGGMTVGLKLRDRNLISNSGMLTLSLWGP